MTKLHSLITLLKRFWLRTDDGHVEAERSLRASSLQRRAVRLRIGVQACSKPRTASLINVWVMTRRDTLKDSRVPRFFFFLGSWGCASCREVWRFCSNSISLCTWTPRKILTHRWEAYRSGQLWFRKLFPELYFLSWKIIIDPHQSPQNVGFLRSCSAVTPSFRSLRIRRSVRLSSNISKNIHILSFTWSDNKLTVR